MRARRLGSVNSWLECEHATLLWLGLWHAPLLPLRALILVASPPPAAEAAAEDSCVHVETSARSVSCCGSAAPAQASGGGQRRSKACAQVVHALR